MEHDNTDSALQTHYAALVYKTAGLLGGEKQLELTPEILAHFVVITSLLDSVAVHEAEERLSGLTDAEVRVAIESILPRDENIVLLWDAGMQQVALRKGELFTRLDAALKSGDLKRLPPKIAELNVEHARELIAMYQRQYGHGTRCENCGNVLSLVASITISNPTCGDEEDHIYYLCEAEGDYNNHVYFKKTIHEEFMTDDVSHHFSGIDQRRAEADIEAIKKCPKPSDKYCNCETHKIIGLIDAHLTKRDFCAIVNKLITQWMIALRLTSFAQSKPFCMNQGACPERGEAESRGGKSELPG